MMRSRNKGVTLIELMIVVAIIGILAAIAYPNYQESTAKSRRGNAQAELMGLSSALERYYSQNNHYSNAANVGNDIGAPAGTLYAVDTQVAALYTVTISSAGGSTANDTDTAQSYIVSAVPRVGSAMENDRCGTMTLSSAGVRTPANPADCWR